MRRLFVVLVAIVALCGLTWPVMAHSHHHKHHHKHHHHSSQSFEPRHHHKKGGGGSDDVISGSSGSSGDTSSSSSSEASTGTTADGTTPTPVVPSATDGTMTMAPAAGVVATGTQQGVNVELTGYSFQDNQGSNNATISQPVIHQKAGGTGTFTDPVTAASPGSAGSTEIPKGTKFYSSKLGRYLIVEDSGATKESTTHLDVWVGGQGGTKSGTDACESAFTGKSSVIKNPPPGLPVTPGPIYANGQCNLPNGASATPSTSGAKKHHKSK